MAIICKDRNAHEFRVDKGRYLGCENCNGLKDLKSYEIKAECIICKEVYVPNENLLHSCKINWKEKIKVKVNLK